MTPTKTKKTEVRSFASTENIKFIIIIIVKICFSVIIFFME